MLFRSRGARVSHLIRARGECDGLARLLDLILARGIKNGNVLEVAGCLLDIQHFPKSWERFCSQRERFLKIGGDVLGVGWSRATRVFTRLQDRMTKPSYIRRLVSYPDTTRRLLGKIRKINQLERIATLLAEKPGYSNLSFVFLRPADLFDQYRPGYVPCPVAGDFKFRNRSLQMSVMFRTSDAFSVGYADIYYLRKIQEDVLKHARDLTNNKDLLRGRVGNLTLFFSRTYVSRSATIRTGSGEKRIALPPLVKKFVRELKKDKS